MTTPVNETTKQSGDALVRMMTAMISAPAQMAAAFAGALTKGAASAVSSAACCGGTSSALGATHSGCEIPPPCWEPQPVGNCALQVTPGGSATIRVHVSNCGWTRQVVALTALGKIAGLMTISPTARFIGPQERGDFLVTIHVPDKARAGASASGPLIIRGCRNYFARVEITVVDCVTSGSNCCDIRVNDCADNVHHWYDHFYCPRPCNSVRVPDKVDPQGVRDFAGVAING